MQTVPQAILSNKPGGYSRRIVEGLGLAARFREVIGGDEAVKKPDPAGLLGICARLGAEPSRCLMIGDSPIDVATGRNAGAPVCAVSWGFSAREELAAAQPRYICDTREELAALLSR